MGKGRPFGIIWIPNRSLGNSVPRVRGNAKIRRCYLCLVAYKSFGKQGAQRFYFGVYLQSDGGQTDPASVCYHLIIRGLLLRNTAFYVKEFYPVGFVDFATRTSLATSVRPWNEINRVQINKKGRIRLVFHSGNSFGI